MTSVKKMKRSPQDFPGVLVRYYYQLLQLMLFEVEVAASHLLNIRGNMLNSLS